MKRVLGAPCALLILSACAATGDLSAVEASRNGSLPGDSRIVCSEPVATTAADGSVASSIQCKRVES